VAHYNDVILQLEAASGANPFGRTGVGFGSESEVSTAVDVVFVGSGYRYSNNRWSQKLRRYNIHIGPQSTLDMYSIRRIFEAVDGPANTFLFHDWADWNTTAGRMERGDQGYITNADQPMQNTVDLSYNTDGSTRTFQCGKLYSVGSAAHFRTITKINQNFTFVVATAGNTVSDYTLDADTGIVTFTGSPAPGTDGGSPDQTPITWGGAFYVPVAFVDNDLGEVLRNYRANGFADIQLIEVRGV
jgi:uncharacterized protein (TIGR02217 family)